MRVFDWRKFRSDTPLELYLFIRDNYWREMDAWEFNWKANDYLPVRGCYPDSIRHYGEDWFAFHKNMSRDYGWFDGRTPRQRYQHHECYTEGGRKHPHE